MKFDPAKFSEKLEEAEAQLASIKNTDDATRRQRLPEVIDSVQSVAEHFKHHEIASLSDMDRAVITELENSLLTIDSTLKQLDEWISMAHIDTKTTLFANKLTAADLRLKAVQIMSDIIIKLKELDLKYEEGNSAEVIGISFVKQMHQILRPADNSPERNASDDEGDLDGNKE